MNTVYFDSSVSDSVRRQRLYNGQLFVFSPRSSVIALRQLACQLIESDFGSPIPATVENSLSVEDFLAAEFSLKQEIMHHPQMKKLIQSMLQEFECDLDKTYFDLPQLRIVPYRGYLPNNEGMFHNPHRDTWYAAPQCLINWWIPLYNFESESALAFHPLYWEQAVNNNSSQFNQGQDYKVQFRTTEIPHPSEKIAIEPEVRIVLPSSGTILFSGAQMHSAVPNTSGLTRYSLDLRTVHYDDVMAGVGAPNIDSHSCFKLLEKFIQAKDLKPFSRNLAKSYQEDENDSDTSF